GDLADGEGAARTGPDELDYHALEGLDPLLLALHHLDLHPHRIADAKSGDVRLKILVLEFLDNAVHGSSPAPRGGKQKMERNGVGDSTWQSTAQAVEDDRCRRAHRQMVIIAGAQDWHEDAVRALRYLRRQAEAGAEQDQQGRAVAFQFLPQRLIAH